MYVKTYILYTQNIFLRNNKNNISYKHKKALEELKSDDLIIIKKADKGGMVVF